MAHSFLELGGAIARVSDAVLEIVIFAFSQEVRAAVARGEISEAEFIPVIERWTSQEVLGCTGCMNLDLPSLVTTAERRDHVLELLTRTEARINSWGERMPADALNILTARQGIGAYQGDLETSRINAVVREFRRVVVDGFGARN